MNSQIKENFRYLTNSYQQTQTVAFKKTYLMYSARIKFLNDDKKSMLSVKHIFFYFVCVLTFK